MAGKKGSKKLGKRYPVQIKCSNPDVGNQYALVVKSVIDHFGLTIASNPTAGRRKKAEGAKPANTRTKNRNPEKRSVPGSSRGRSIRIPADADGKKFKSMPIPPGATIEDMRTFLNGVKNNKPPFFITDGGRTVFLNAKR